MALNPLVSKPNLNPKPFWLARKGDYREGI
jgi:hypothetical protein